MSLAAPVSDASSMHAGGMYIPSGSVSWDSQKNFISTGFSCSFGANRHDASSYSERSAVYKDRLEWVESELNDILRACGHANWDGYGAEPINLSTVKKVREFLLADLSQIASLPDILPEPTGNISLEWFDSGVSLIARFTPIGDIAFNFKDFDGHVMIGTSKVGTFSKSPMAAILKEVFPCI